MKKYKLNNTSGANFGANFSNQIDLQVQIPIKNFENAQ